MTLTVASWRHYTHTVPYPIPLSMMTSSHAYSNIINRVSYVRKSSSPGVLVSVDALAARPELCTAAARYMHFVDPALPDRDSALLIMLML